MFYFLGVFVSFLTDFFEKNGTSCLLFGFLFLYNANYQKNGNFPLVWWLKTQKRKKKEKRGIKDEYNKYRG